MKFNFLLFALLVVAYTHTGCRNVEQEQRKLALDSLTAIRRVADSVEQISAIPGALFGSKENDAAFAISNLDIIDHNSFNGFQYDHIEPYYFENGLMEVKIIGHAYSWSEYDSVYETISNCVEIFNGKYGNPTDMDSTLQKKMRYDEARLFGWKKGDKGVSIRIVSDYYKFLFEIDIWSDKMQKAYARSIADRVRNPL